MDASAAEAVKATNAACADSVAWTAEVPARVSQ